jgi:hypothetical protein
MKDTFLKAAVGGHKPGSESPLQIAQSSDRPLLPYVHFIDLAFTAR